MDFTREPIIETVITPKEGCKLVVRSSKSAGQEEYFVDALEVVSFGGQSFFRSLERPKAFLVPTSDYEVLEVREARMVLKNVGLDRSIKIGGGREAVMRPTKEAPPEKHEEEAVDEALAEAGVSEPKAEAPGRGDKKRDRRRNYRRRRGREEGPAKEGQSDDEAAGLSEEGKVELPFPNHQGEDGLAVPSLSPQQSGIPSLLPPPSTLISETIARYKDNALFKGAFYTKEEAKEEAAEAPKVEESVPSTQPEFGSFEMNEEDEGDSDRQRHREMLEESQETSPHPISEDTLTNGNNP